MVTDEIETFTEDGIFTTGGRHLPADVVITATGFDLTVFGDIDFTVDGEPVDFARSVTYRGIMFSGVPNMAWTFGALRLSWTMRVEMVSQFICRLLDRMDQGGAACVVPHLRPEDADI
jgi:monooxygenase